MIRTFRRYSLARLSEPVLVSLLLGLLLGGAAAVKSWWEGAPGYSPGPPPHLDLRGSPTRMPVEVVRVVDGDTFDAIITLRSGQEVVARIRLRGVDAPELHAMCAAELVKAEAARDLLRRLLDEGAVTLFAVGEEKYGRVLADVSTRRTASISAALIAAGVARRYDGGHRFGWCDRSDRAAAKSAPT